MLHYFLMGLAVLALLSIVFEEVIHINKAKTTLFFGCLSWVLLFFFADSAQERENISHFLNENLLEIATLWLFLMSTMTFVAYLNAKGLIQTFVQKLFPHELSKRLLLILVALFALVLSAICDNVTATLVTIGLIQSFDLEKQDRLKMAALTVFAVNSGGVALITGDVTTLMIFLAGHVDMGQLLILLIPSAVSVVALAVLFSFGMHGRVTTEVVQRTFTSVDIAIAIVFFATIICTMLFNIFFSIPPVLTFLMGLSIMFLIGRTVSTDAEQTQVLEYIRQIEYDTLLFFLGILMLVGMLQEIQVLEQVARWYSELAPIYSNYIAGVVSALLDNVPLTAALLKANPELTTSQWLGLTYSVGVGGSLLIIGSAAGIITMSKVKEMTFGAYMRYFPALLICYTIGYLLSISIPTLL